MPVRIHPSQVKVCHQPGESPKIYFDDSGPALGIRSPARRRVDGPAHMPLHVVTRKKTDSTTRVPDALQLGTAMLASLREHQVLANVASWLPLSRRAGHGTRGLFAFVVVFLMAGRAWGIRPFALQFGNSLGRLVAPVAGLRALPTAASMSPLVAVSAALQSIMPTPVFSRKSRTSVAVMSAI